MFICMLHCIVNNMTKTIIFQNAEMLAMQIYKHIIRIPQIYTVVSYLYIICVMCVYVYMYIHTYAHMHIVFINFWIIKIYMNLKCWWLRANLISKLLVMNRSLYMFMKVFIFLGKDFFKKLFSNLCIYSLTVIFILLKYSYKASE